jgi:hypothetical protein
MRRAVTLFLLLVLPLQLSWAVAAVYCQHEAVAQVAGHLGHHEHQHAQADEVAGDVAKQHVPEQKDAGDKAQCVDDDCAYCHLASLKTVNVPVIVLDVLAGSTFSGQAVPPLESHTNGGIDRPNWRAA